MEQINIKKMYKEILLLKKIVIAMQEDLEDRFLSADEELEIEKARKEYEEGNIISFEDLKKELDV